MQGAVLAVLDAPQTAPALLAAAARLAPLLATTAKALAIRIPAEATILPSEEVLTDRHRSRWDAAEQSRLAALAAAASAEGVALRQAAGNPPALLAEAAAAAGLLVLARPTADSSETDRALLHTALFTSGRPVLLLPPGTRLAGPARIALAWQDDGRAEKAIRAALPLLQQAAALRLLATAPAIPRPLADANLRAETVLLGPEAGDAPGEAILAAAAGCDLLVMGAYAHSRLREFVFGGVTRHVLEAAGLPVLMCH